MNYVTKCEPRPIRAYIACGEYESLGYWGHNVEAAVSLARCLFWNNYPYRYEYLASKMHTWGMGDFDEQVRAMEYIWQDWEEPVVTGKYNKYLNRYVDKENGWEEAVVSETPTAKSVCSFGEYQFEDGAIYLKTKNGHDKVTEGFGKVTGVSVSCDEAFLYVTDAFDRGITCMTIGENGALSHPRSLSAQLHLPPAAKRLGASGIVCDSADNIYLATEWGIQIAPAAGNICAVIPLPGDLPVDALSLSGNILYAVSGNRCFKRTIKQCAVEPESAGNPADLGDPGQDFGQLTNKLQTEYDQFKEEEALKTHLWNTSFFYPHPAL